MTTLVIISFLTSLLAVVLFSKFAFNKKATTEKISSYQKELDEMDRNANVKYGLDWHHDATEELEKQRREKKSWWLFYIGLTAAFIAIIGGVMMQNMPLAMTTVIIALVFIIAGMISLAKGSQNQGLAYLLLVVILIGGIVAMRICDMMLITILGQLK